MSQAWIMLPPGHLAVSYLVGKLPRSQLKPALIAGLLPDIDFLLLPLSAFNQLHRVVTHNLLFVLICGWLAGRYLCPSGHRRWGGVVAVASGLCHLLVDACLDANPSNGLGVAWLWPLSRQTYAPMNLLPPTAVTVGWEQPLAMLSVALQGVVWEVPVYVLAIGYWAWQRRHDPTA